jgi:hypothetical protein
MLLQDCLLYHDLNLYAHHSNLSRERNGIEIAHTGSHEIKVTVLRLLFYMGEFLMSSRILYRELAMVMGLALALPLGQATNTTKEVY